MSPKYGAVTIRGRTWYLALVWRLPRLVVSGPWVRR